MIKSVRRRFLQVGERTVHYFRAGDGPPAVLVHSSPANARLLMREILHLAAHHTVFAFDTPGFGLSQPLPLDEMEVADLADALADTLHAAGMPRCPVFGTHTGAAIALELGARHPERVTGLVLDGVPAFTPEECDAFFQDYFRKLPVTDLGGIYAEIWTRFRDQSIWFPWSERRAAHLNPYDLGSPTSTHLWASMYFDAAETYTPAYRAASFYGQRAIRAAQALSVPAIYTATDTDMLRPHIDRLPPMKPGQSFRPIGTSHDAKLALIAEGFATFGVDGAAPADRDAVVSTTTVARQFIDGTQGQLHLRSCGDRGATPCLLIHDAPGSAEQIEDLIAAMGTQAFVIAPDLPGHGESDPLTLSDVGGPDLDAFAAEMLHVLDRLGIDRVRVAGIGFGSSVAVRLSVAYPDRVQALAINGALLPDATERAHLSIHYAPPIAIEADGSHWYRTWLMLRDSRVWWPWFDRRMDRLRRVEADFAPRPLHRWTMDVMRARETYAAVIHAALAGDLASDLARLAAPPIVVSDPAIPLFAYDDTLRAARPDAVVRSSDGTPMALALAFLGDL